MADFEDVIQAFVDDEPVDPSALERALAEPQGRAHLIDTVVLRGFVRHSSVVPSSAALPPARAVARPFGWMAVAAAIAAVTTVGGYLAGKRASTQQPATIAATTSEAQGAASDRPVAAPAPAYVIRLEPGVDWNERGGGH